VVTNDNVFLEVVLAALLLSACGVFDAWMHAVRTKKVQA